MSTAHLFFVTSQSSYLSHRDETLLDDDFQAAIHKSYMCNASLTYSKFVLTLSGLSFSACNFLLLFFGVFLSVQALREDDEVVRAAHSLRSASSPPSTAQMELPFQGADDETVSFVFALRFALLCFRRK